MKDRWGIIFLRDDTLDISPFSDKADEQRPPFGDSLSLGYATVLIRI